MEDINIRLKNEELSAVQFILDYVQVHFHDKGFTFYIWPTVEFENKSFKFGDIEYRNKLCEIIGKKVINVFIIEKKSLIIDFGNIKITEDLNPYNPDIISEICLFQDKTDYWVW